ncbi:MAG TPA: sigma factor-like helix-turn-helix DNA-binding protein [Acidobacteriaceae bacterium]|jgi:RNA polymerase sigma-70 factor (ECF subfamily)|nr:sigma factor-like helix-turn-helix DNA-binding protein [Acidobacteriaceae bacterium]
MLNRERDLSLLRTEAAATQSVEQSAEQSQRDIFESHRHRVFSLAFYMTGNELEAEEILGQTFVRAFQRQQRPGAQEIDASLIGELHGRFSLKAQLPPATSCGEESLTGRNVRRSDLEAALLDLPPNERLLFLLRDVEGMAPTAIAGLLGIPLPELQRLLLSARLRLCQNLSASLGSAPEEEAA